jgi:hypothetical protein
VSKPFGPWHEAGIKKHAQLMLLAREEPEKAWKALRRIVDETDDDGLFWVADILEDLATYHPVAFAARIEGELTASPRLRRAFLDFVPTVPLDEPEMADWLLGLRVQIEQELGVGDAEPTG